MKTNAFQLILTTCPTAELAANIAQTLVAERLAACVNIMPPMQSVYRWKGKIEFASEQLLIIKSRISDYDAIEQRLRALHTYELPEVIAVPIIAGLAQYLTWLESPDLINEP